MWETLENAGWVQKLGDSVWMYTVASVVHYFSIFVFVGLVVVLDLHILGLTARRRTATELAEQWSLWAWIFLGLALVSGFLEFSVTAGDYVQTWAFRAKILVVLAAMICTFIVRCNVSKWDRLPTIPVQAKLLALASLLLWIGSILAGTELAPLTGLG